MEEKKMFKNGNSSLCVAGNIVTCKVENESEFCVFKKKYRRIQRVSKVEGELFIKCCGKNTMDIFSTKTCKLVLTASIESKVQVKTIKDELFFKISSEKGQFIYDRTGRLLGFEGKNQLNVIESETGPIIEEKCSETGKTIFWTIDGRCIV